MRGVGWDRVAWGGVGCQRPRVSRSSTPQPTNRHTQGTFRAGSCRMPVFAVPPIFPLKNTLLYFPHSNGADICQQETLAL